MPRKNSETGRPDKKRHPFRNWTILAVGTFAGMFALILTFFLLLGDRPAAEVVADGIFWETVLVFYGILLIAFLFMYKVDAGRLIVKDSQLDDAKWLTPETIGGEEGFFRVKFSELKNSEDGTVIYAKSAERGRDVDIVMTSELHTLIVGSSGTGKTTGFVDPNIAILSKCAGKPSMIITDPKKELYDKHAKNLRARGYDVVVLDLRKPYESLRWNPFCTLQRRVVEIMEINEKLETIDYASDEEYPDKELAKTEAEVRKQTVTDEMEDNAKDIIYTLCPIKNKDQPSWENGARNLILAFLLAMCEDAIEGKIPVEKIILFNLYQNITSYCQEDTSMFKAYLLERGNFSKVRGLANTVLVTSDKTLTSYLTDVSAYMQQLADTGILSMTSSSEIDPFSLDDRPTAVFLVVPDEKETRHPFVSLFVAQMYKELTEKCNVNLAARVTDTAKLKRNVYFILDEFGNIPPIYRFETVISVARARGFRFLLILQSFAQLDAVYGANTATTIKDNCAVKIFIGTDDAATKKEFSALCGTKVIKSVSVSTSLASDPSSSTSVREVPLITEAQLQRLNGSSKGDAVVSVRGHFAIWGYFSPSYKLKSLYCPKSFKKEEHGLPRMFDREGMFVDIKDILPAKPLTEEEIRRKAAYDKEMDDYVNKWEVIMKTENVYGDPSAEKEGNEISERDEEYLKELDMELACEEEPDEADVCLDLDRELERDFPQLTK